jgi:predicted nuclease with TOPRIM domain
MEKEHFEIILEDINGKFQLVIEGHQMLAERMDRFESRIEDRMDRFESRIEDRMGHFESRIEDRMGHFESRIQDRMGTIEIDIQEIKESIGSINSNLKRHDTLISVPSSSPGDCS